MVGAVRGDLDDLSTQPPHQRGIFAHRVYHHDPVAGGKEHIDQLSFCRKGLARSRGAEVHSVGRFQLFAVSHDDIMGKGVHAVVQGLSVHTQLTGHKGNKDRRGAGCHTALDLNAVVPQHQRGQETLLLLPVQSFQSAVVFLRDAGHGKYIVFQTLAAGRKVDDGKGQKEHSLVAGLQIGQQLRRILGKGNEVGGQNLHIVPGPDSLFLFLGLHAANVGDFTLDGFNGLELIHRLNMERHRQLGIQLQDFSQQLIRHFRRQNLQVGRSSPRLAHPECTALPEVEAVRGNKVFRTHASSGNILPRKSERLPTAGVELPMQGGQPIPAIEGPGLYPQPLEVAHHIGLYTIQTGPGLGHAASGQTKGDVFGAFNAVVAFGNLAFEHIHELAPDAVERILLGRDIHLVTVGRPGTPIDERKLERQGTVKVIEE